MSPTTRVFATLAVTTVLVAAVHGQKEAIPPTLQPAAVRAAIEGALAVAPSGFGTLASPRQAGVRVVGVAVETVPAAPQRPKQRITIDLSQKALTYDPDGDVEAILDHVVRSTAPLTAAADDVEYRFLIDGLPLDRFVSRAEPRPRAAPRAAGSPRVLISAGHGWYWHEGSATWRLQRDHYWGIVEDVVNWEMADLTIAGLRGTRFETLPARDPGRDPRPGPSGHPWWQHGAVYFLKNLGAPPEVWTIGVDDYARDINSRPFYANWVDASAVVSIHNNGGGGTGTETWFDETNGYAGESRRLAEVMNDRVVTAIRRFYDPNWPDRGLRSCNGCHGENRLATRPAVILEVAFMDMKTPDNAALQDSRFRQIVAYGIRDALHVWAGIPPPADD
jgi:N-acetylmuramoyl-L-alanine amidase